MLTLFMNLSTQNINTVHLKVATLSLRHVNIIKENQHSKRIIRCYMVQNYKDDLILYMVR